MTKTKSTKRALLLSALSLLMCVSMLIGSTFAWFTDSVTSAGNIIKSGTLDVTMEWAEGKNDPANTAWTDASNGAIFNNDKWEPGYVEVRHIKIANAGSLALKYKVNIVANGTVSKLADAIDVYYLDPAKQIDDRADLDGLVPLGTLSEVLANLGSDTSTATGNLLANENHTVTLAFKMREEAGNEYQGKAIGSDFAVQLVATQYTYEEDSFGNNYDANAKLPIPVSSAADLKTAMLVRGGLITLEDDIVVDKDTPLQWGQYMFVANGRETTIDLNGHNITVDKDSSKKIVYLFTTANGGTLNIIGNGTLEIQNESTGICWAMNKNDQINIYGGEFKSNADYGPTNHLLYTNSGSIDVYGGKFYGEGQIFNVADDQGNRLCIELHDGTLLGTDTYYAGSDAPRIQLAEDCTLKEVVIDGVTWYRVVKE